uniref:spermatogenesis-associated protein 6-like isoform X1 n=1 Tax=Styela clava TaxID=7725 RepID=UPI001939454D|nr:spermatogenesis-associated protein 6-like isoform X1 [Styela clava]
MPRRKALKVVVEVEFHAVTCPGVFLPAREEVFLNVEIFGQLKRTQYHPPVFPFLFHERIRFEKVFCQATDPIQVAQELCSESVNMELIQLSYPGGELLGTYTDNARDFLFPTPKVSPTYPGVDREVLFQRTASFPGIAPKLEFSSRTIIKEVTSSGKSLGDKKRKERHLSAPQPLLANGGTIPTHKTKTSSGIRTKTSPQKQRSPVKKGKTKKNNSTEIGRGRTNQRSKSANRATTMWGYEQPTIASRARSPSPYTRRRMAELSINDPFESATRAKPFKTEVDSRPEFVVRKVPEDALSLERTPPPPRSPSCERRTPQSRSYTPTRKLNLSPRQNGMTSPRNGYGIQLSNSSDDTDSISSEYSDIARSNYVESYRTGYLEKPKPYRPWQRSPSPFHSYTRYLSTKQDARFPEGRCEAFIPIGVHSPRTRRQSTPRTSRFSEASPITCSDCPSPSKPRLKSCLVSRSAPPTTRSFSKYSSARERRRTAERITTCLEDLLSEVRRSDKGKDSFDNYKHNTRKKSGLVRFKDGSGSDLHTSMRCGRGTPTGSRLSSARSNPSPQEPRFSLADLCTAPTSTYGRESSTVTPSSILHRTPLEQRMRGHSSPYEKIRDRVRALLSSPRATQIAENAMQEGQERYRQRMSRSRSPSPPRVSVRLNDNEYWNEMASVFTGRSHRAVFENNLDKIYDDIYTNLKNSK